MLVIGQTITVSFNVSVFGTGVQPVVRVLLDTTPALAFSAKKISTETWESEITVPEFVEPKSYTLQVEVLLDNKIFTPLKQAVQITSSEQSIEVKATPAEPVKVEQQSVQQVQQVQEQVKPIIKTASAKKEKKSIQSSKEPLIKSFALNDPAEINRLKKAEQKKINDAVIKAFTETLSSLSEQKSESIKKPIISIEQIEKEAESFEDQIFENSRVVEKPTTLIETKIPVRLVKGDIVYRTR